MSCGLIRKLDLHRDEDGARLRRGAPRGDHRALRGARSYARTRRVTDRSDDSDTPVDGLRNIVRVHGAE